MSAVVLVALGAELHGSKSGDLLDIGLAAVEPGAFLAVHEHDVRPALCASAITGRSTNRPAPKSWLSWRNRPDYWDFAYFSFVIGMTFQVSDVSINDRHIRRIALMHGVIAFFFDVVIVALSVNLIAGNH